MGDLENRILEREMKAASEAALAAEKASRESEAQQKALHAGRALATEFVELATRYGVPREAVYTVRCRVTGFQRYEFVSREYYADCWRIWEGVYITADAMTLKSTHTESVEPGRGLFSRGAGRYVINGWKRVPFVDFMTSTPDPDGGFWDTGMASDHMTDVIQKHVHSAAGEQG